MKKFIAIASSACILFAAQSAMAFTGFVNAGDFSSESAALKAGQQVAEEIVAGSNSVAMNEISQECITAYGIQYTAPEVNLKRTWAKTTSGLEKRYEANVDFSYTCVEQPRL